VAVLSIAAYRKPELIAQTLIKCYHKVFKVSKQPDRHVVVVMLSLNMEYGIGEGVREPFLPDKNDPKKGSQVESLINTCNYFIDHRKGKKANGSIIPYICIDPNRHDAYRIFLEAFARAKYNYPFFGVKVYPCLGYLPNHPVLMDIFKVCEEKNIPVLTHCGGTTTRTDADSVWIAEWRKNAEPETYNQAFERAKGDDKEHAYEEFFLAPKRWLPVLEEYPNLRLNIAHLGSDRQWENYLKGGLQNEMKGNFVHQTLQIIQKYPNVYADISYSLAADANLRCIQQLMLDHPEIKRKLLFGSDYYVLLKAQKIKGAVKDFYEIFGNTPELIQALTVDNPKRHLFA
jgi:predicted TIM-barrel fold metal-dependent hydrolase